MSRNCILNKKSRWGTKTYPMIMPDIKSVNIDTKYDLLIAKLLIQSGFCKNQPLIQKILKNLRKIKLNYSLQLRPFLKSFEKDIAKKYDCIFAEGIEKVV